jgi:hypothetical protein
MAFCPAARAAGGFHPPATEAEMTLAKIIDAVQDDGELPSYLLHHRTADKLRDAQNREMFTPALLDALTDTEANMVHNRCGGYYVPGEKCGISYNPITCLNFERNAYFYRTDSAGAYSLGDYNAVIAFKLPEGLQIVATYNMLKIDGKWKLDGVECTLGGSFNM